VPVLASETLDAGPRTFGVLSAAFGAGALVGALLTASIGRASWKGLIAGVGGFSVSLLVLAPIQTVVACAVLLFVVGVCFTLWTANSQSILQLSAPDHLRGRVLSLWLFAFAGLAPLGGLFAGWLSDIGGTELAFYVAGVTGLLMTLLALRELYPAARRGSEVEPPPEPGFARREAPQQRASALKEGARGETRGSPAL
jgi:MFS family permease